MSSMQSCRIVTDGRAIEELNEEDQNLKNELEMLVARLRVGILGVRHSSFF